MNEHFYSTEDLSVLFNVGKSTIKRWADEGKLHCFKTPGGHRKFTVSDVQEFIEKFKYEVNAPPAILKPHHGKGTLLETLPLELYHEKKNRICSSAVQGNKIDIIQCITEVYRNHIPLSTIFDNILLPSLHYLVENSSLGKISAVELQIARTSIFSALVHFENIVIKPEPSGKEVYCITTNDGMNSIELKALELILESEGIKAFNLGGALSMFSAQELIEKCRPDDVFVVATYTPVDDHFTEQFTQLKKGVDSYGGNLIATCFTTNNDNVAFLMRESNSLEKSYSDVMKHVRTGIKTIVPSTIKIASSL